MSEPVGYKGEMHTVWRMRPCNCDPQVGVNSRCPHCNQYHLRPGYCQALDPINVDKYRAVDKPDVDTDVDTTVDTPVAVDTAPVDTAEERRKHYQAEWIRRKREAMR